MDSSNVRTGRLTWLGEFDRYQWTVFLIAWIGWALDSTDFALFAIVLRPAARSTRYWRAARIATGFAFHASLIKRPPPGKSPMC